jgi:hypothetical protein
LYTIWTAPLLNNEGATMKILTTIFVSACFAGLTQPAWSQASEHNGHGILGYLDPKTGAFKPMAKSSSEEIEPLVTSVAGDFKVTFNITVKSAIPATAPIMCLFTASVFDVTSGLSMEESMSVAATGSGASRKCVLDMFYSWPLSSASSDSVSLDYSVSTGVAGLTRSSSQSLPSKKPPPSGTTTVTISSTI